MSDYYDPVHASAQATTSHTHLQHHHQLHPPPLASLSPPSKPQSVFADYHLQHPQLLHHGHQHQLLQNQHQQQLQLQLQQQQQQLRHYRSNSSPQQLLNNQNNYHIASSSSSSPTPTPNFTMQAPPSTSPPLGGKPKATRRRRTVVKADVADDPSDGSSSSGNNQTASPPVASANAPRYVQIKTKFPVARIKRIMQADEDVGKVAQVTPVVVNKALELFMISLCDKASEEARLRNSKRITAGHLKQAILHYEQFDFLADIIQKIADIPAPSAEGSNLTSNGSDSPEDVQPAKKTRRPRQKKAKDDDSF